jgi:hypothetical protein
MQHDDAKLQQLLVDYQNTVFLKIGIEQYEQGATDFTTILTAEQNLFQAESNVATASANVALGATAIYRALGGGWQIREDSYFVTAATRDQMQARTNWGRLLPPAGEAQPPAPGLPTPANIGPTFVRRSGEATAAITPRRGCVLHGAASGGCLCQSF